MSRNRLLGAVLVGTVAVVGMPAPAAQDPVWGKGWGAWPGGGLYDPGGTNRPRLGLNGLSVDSPYRRHLTGIVRDFATNRAALRVALQDKRMQLRSELARPRARPGVVKDLYSDIFGLRLEIQQNRLEAMQRFQQALSEVPAEAFLSGRFRR